MYITSQCALRVRVYFNILHYSFPVPGHCGQGACNIRLSELPGVGTACTLSCAPPLGVRVLAKELDGKLSCFCIFAPASAGGEWTIPFLSALIPVPVSVAIEICAARDAMRWTSS